MVETYYIHLEVQTKAGDWSINLPFLCDKCGVCCTLDDFLTAGEIRGSPEANSEVYAKFNTLTEELGKLFEEDEDKYDQHVTQAKCPFQTDNICSIYAIRPEGCRQFPNTPFGMLSKDCKALDRFKKQRLALKRGRASKETGCSTVNQIMPVKFSKSQYDACLDKLCHAGITKEERALFNALNGQS
ncbi:MAG: YkgJ family cysteine cluster protein [Candidatus Bathyarchaeota archaeon]|nr:YkgJ family cysteine cluster protein [Candidatus Termiticorpusculum sp.]